MIITREHALALLELRQRKDEGKGPLAVVEGTRDAEVMLELEMQNLARVTRPFEYSLTYWGEIISRTLKELVGSGKLKEPSLWSDGFRWIGSEVINMIGSSILLEGRVSDDIFEHLAQRGFADEVKVEKKGKQKVINDFAREVFDTFNKITPRLVITRELAEYIKGIVPGPAERGALPDNAHAVFLLEAMRLIAFSVPSARVWALTGLGQAVKEVVDSAPLSLDVIISEDILEDFVKAFDEGIASLTDKAKEILFSLALFDEQGNLLPAGEKLLEVYRMWKGKSYRTYRTFSIDVFEIEILKAIERISSKNSLLATREEILREMFERPIKEYKHLINYYGRKIDEEFGYKKKEEIRKKFEELKTVEEIFKHFFEKGGRWKQKMMELVVQALYSLESFELITPHLDANGKTYWTTTEFGKRILRDAEQHGIRTITATAVKAITITKREYSAPNFEWYEQAVEQNLVRGGTPTASGKLYSELAWKVKRKPHLTKFELMVLHRIPERGMFLDELFGLFDELLREEVEWAVEKLSARGILDILPTQAVILTDAGKLMKRAVSPIPEGLANPVNPTMFRLIEAIAEVGNLYVKEQKVRILPRQLEEIKKRIGMEPQEFEDGIELLRAIGMLGKNSLHSSALDLIRAVRMIQEESLVSV